VTRVPQVWRTLRAAHDEHRATGVEFEGLRTVPGWTLRAAAGLTSLAAVLTAGFAGLRGPLGLIGDGLALLFVVLVVVRPRHGALALLLLLVGLRVLSGDPLAPWRLALLLLAVHLAVLVTGLAARLEARVTPDGVHGVGRRTRVEVAVLTGLVRHAWPLQLGAQVLGLIVWLVGRGATLPAGDVWRALAMLVVAALLVAVLPARKSR